MGLLLSVLVVCVGVIEVISLYKNVKNNIRAIPSDPGALPRLRYGYIRELHDVRDRILSDIQKLTDDEAVEINSCELPDCKVGKTDVVLPKLALNSIEDVDVSCVEKCRVEFERKPENLPSPLRKSKCEHSLPEFLSQEDLCCENKDCQPSCSGAKFVENNVDSYVSYREHERCSSPYPFAKTDHRISNAFGKKDACLVLEEDEIIFTDAYYDDDDEEWTKLDDLLSSNFDSTEYWSNKILIEPSQSSCLRKKKESKSAEGSPSMSRKLKRVKKEYCYSYPNLNNCEDGKRKKIDNLIETNENIQANNIGDLIDSNLKKNENIDSKQSSTVEKAKTPEPFWVNRVCVKNLFVDAFLR